MQICENIRLAREASGLSQEDMAQKIGKHRNTYQNWEYKTEPSLPIIKAIAEALEIPAYTLLTGIIDFEPKETSGGIIQVELQQIKESLNKLTLSIGRLAGLSKEATYEAFSFSSDKKLGKVVFREFPKGKPKGKSSKKSK